jgi:hypothetical protein
MGHTPDHRPSAAARWVNVALGAWLFISVFVWPHAYASATNSWIVGLAIMVVALTSMYIPGVRWLNTGLAVWLFVSAFAFSHVTTGTVWNNAIVAIVVLVASLKPGGLHIRTTGRFAPPGPRVAI